MRKAEIKRKTKETNIALSLNLDGEGKSSISTPFGMLTHMLEQISKHASVDLNIKVEGDTETGSHHVVEDTAIVLGEAFDKALGDRAGIERMADSTVPLDESLSMVAIDLAGRGYHSVEILPSNQIGDFPTDMARHFFETLAVETKMALHIKTLAGKNEHHIIESVFKAFSKTFKKAIKVDENLKDVIPSTKGTLT
ncbi:MAG: imidazoleglycerol-phosphate dehydratase HisB [Chloroflexota bacterium]|jgi:imidazoleglycerol-phosphate dehydratase|nr:imidazoleglycerol-phosphate dehydratase HisB [Chloroflexota bacterium]MEC7271083.1 imidazoleglycerol-phosphate dehydratase HisB [Chloroflexota bacterium]MEC8440637.1 imidazoleglycerol-phosphate dehydratase HisB [Chloroflexota bacterium]|tara:strand:- start:58 stop:645 length:588 start_codon:yes stop_codon:yes gene_type:complete